MKRYLLFFFLIVLATSSIFGQSSNATLFGVVTDEKGKPLEMVTVFLKNYPFGTTTNRKGEFLLRIPSGREIIVGFSSLGYQVTEKTYLLKEEESFEENITLISKNEELGEVVIIDRSQTSGNIVRINPRSIDNLPDVGVGSVEGLIKTLPGVTSSNELSNQYSVRGGSFDENLVYVNDIEVYRPYLIRAGEQEGLSFVNSDMVSSIEFSAGGFDAKYGDKMSSVLDIKYHRPTEFHATASASFLGGKAQVENISKDKKFTYNMGARYKTFKYLLASLEKAGSYNPSFLDFQGYFTYSLGKKLELSVLGTASANRYQFTPEAQRTKTGLFNQQYSLRVDYEGQEIDRYDTYTGAMSLNWKPTHNLFLKLTASAFTTSEQETYDIVGYYYLHDVQNEGTEEQEDTSMNIGVGFYHEHGRNYMDANVMAIDHRGGLKTDSHFLQWGFNAKQELVDDRMNEWEYRDSAGYSLPYSNKEVQLYYLSKNDHQFNEQRYSGFVQDSYTLPLDIGNLMLTGGVRAHYWTYTDKLSISPRFSASLNTGVERDIVTRVSFGWYSQPAFYRELKDLYGNINPDIQTPRSFQMVAGIDYSFIGWDRPFRLTTEAYYKNLKDLIPYQIENVRIRYLSNQISNGYAYGLDFKVNGEFVSGTQSWISMSLMKTAEDIEGDYGRDNYPAHYIPRPSDQRFKFSMYFQDYLPGLPAYQMHLTGHFITGAPFGMPRSERHTQTARMPAYKRVDIGFMRAMVSNGKNLTDWKFFDRFSDFDVSLEIFNMIDIQNVSSYIFIPDFDNIYHPIPNHLTGRTFNLKVSAAF
ncbi:MAG: carboxypeptidase-like regulatory domain-containing protein [Prolixibacteraceae bacterium]